MDRRNFFKVSLAGGASFSMLGATPLWAKRKHKDKKKKAAKYFSDLGTFDERVLRNLVQKYGSPLYVYDGDLMIKKYREFEEAFLKNYPQVKVHYAFKANTNLNVLTLFKNLGAGGECISKGEVQMGIKAGYNPRDIMFTSNSKSIEELEFAVKKGVIINLDSIPDLKNLIEVCHRLKKRVKVSFRINPDVNPHTHKNISTGHKFTKFGILQTEKEVLEAYKTAKEDKYLNPIGVHSHIGSQILDVEPFLKNVEILTSVIIKLKHKLGLELQFINLGGGLGIPYKDEEEGLSPITLAKTVCPVIKEKLTGFKKLPELWLEPGRYFVAQSGIFLSTVNSVKMTSLKNFINVNTGFNHLARPLLYEAHHRVRILGKKESDKFLEYEVAGNICETGDILANKRLLPLPQVGDILAFLDAGAYGFSMSSEYNSFLLPAEVIIRKNKSYLIRKREDFADLIRNQVRHPEVTRV